MKFLHNLPAWDAAFAAIVIFCTAVFALCVVLIVIVRKNEQLKECREQLRKSEREKLKAQEAEANALAQVELMRGWWREAEEEKAKLLSELAEKQAG